MPNCLQEETDGNKTDGEDPPNPIQAPAVTEQPADAPQAEEQTSKEDNATENTGADVEAKDEKNEPEKEKQEQTSQNQEEKPAALFGTFAEASGVLKVPEASAALDRNSLSSSDIAGDISWRNIFDPELVRNTTY